MEIETHLAQKFDESKQEWFALPLELLRPLADVAHCGEKKYSIFNMLGMMPQASRRLWNAAMRHLDACQLDPLARDEETGCCHAAQAAFNLLLRVYQANKYGDIGALSDQVEPRDSVTDVMAINRDVGE
jgi:hypothetical protein